jgi:asparagine synthase (glutamine-hydrolysing)
MCGIIGFVKVNSLSSSLSLDSAVQFLSHRGPDDIGVYEDNNFGLGHARLSIIDLSALGHQPMKSDNGQVVLVYNGEIYNFKSLRESLIEKGYVFNSQSDTEVLLNLYFEFGKDMLLHINGIFSFAIWDYRSNSLFLARDALGVKPLYYAETTQGFIFSSEIKALVELDNIKKDLDYASLNRYLSFLWCPGEGTPFKQVRKVQPGRALIISQGKIESEWTWYNLPIYTPSTSPIKRNDAILGTAKHLQQAVERQMVADVPVGAFLSGGLDSSAIVAFAKEINPEIRCFTIKTSGGNEQDMLEDLPYAKKVAKHLNVQLDVISVDANQMAHNLEKMVVQLDEPLADPACLNVLYISQLARDNGIKVLLSGTGGDDLFTGYRRHFALSLERYWNWMPSVVRSKFENMTAALDQRNVLSRRLTKMFNGSGLSGDNRLINYLRWNNQSDLYALYSSDFKNELHDKNAELPMLSFLDNLPTGVNSMDKMLALEQRFFLSDHNLIYTDKMSMAAGVEVRVPFLDKDLIQFAAKIPAKYKQKGREGKWVLKRAMEPYLPKDVIYRPKSGFGVPLRNWIQYELRELLGDLLSEESIKKRGLFDHSAVQNLIKENDLGVRDGSYTILSLLCIELWCRNFIDQ